MGEKFDGYNRICPECGTEFYAGGQWAYKKNGVYFCRWTCYRKNQREKEETVMGKLSLEEKKQAVEIAIAGGDQLAYLKEHWAKNPSAAWFQIKKKLADADPAKNDALEKAMHSMANRKWKENKKAAKAAEKEEKMEKQTLELEAGGNYEVSVKDAMDGAKEAADTFFRQCEEMGLAKANTPEGCSGLFHGTKGEKAVSEEAPGLKTVAVEHQLLGEFYYDRKYSSIDWRTPEGDEVSMPPSMWMMMAADLPRILGSVGVKL